MNDEKLKLLDEIEKLAEFHSVEVPVIYGDGTKSMEKMISMEELSKILEICKHGEKNECI